MNPITLSQAHVESMVWSILPLYGFVLTLFLFGLNSPVKASDPPVETRLTSRAVWRIENDNARGTAAAIGPYHVLTAAHVVKELLDGPDAERIYLSRKGHPSVVNVSQILAISTTYEFALLETTERLKHYLSPATGFSKAQTHRLYMIGYPKGSYKVLQQEQRLGHEDQFSYEIATNKHIPKNQAKGFSGAPIINKHGELVSMLFAFDSNIAYGVKIEYLRQFLLSNTGVSCFRFVSYKSCFGAAKEETKRMAAIDAVAQYQLGARNYLGTGGDVRIWLQEAARRDLISAQRELGLHYYFEEGKDFEKAAFWFQRAAEADDAVSQYMLASMLRKGEGVQKNPEKAFHWSTRSAVRYVPAQHLKGLMLYNGLGTVKDRELAKVELRKAATMGYPASKAAWAEFKRRHGDR